MSALAMAGNSMVSGYTAPIKPPIGIRTLREEYTKFTSRLQIPQNLRMISDRIEREKSGEVLGSEERHSLQRFQHLFAGNEPYPPGIFMAALELKDSEILNGQKYSYEPEVMSLRDSLVMAYKPLVAKIRLILAKELDELPLKPCIAFNRAWSAWEGAWLQSREHHAVTALQPLAKAILSLEPLLLSVDKERLLPWPRVQHQKAVTLKCLDGFMHQLSELSANVLPSLHRELDHDSRLLLVMDHVLSLRGDKSVESCLDGVSAAPDVSFPEAQDKKADATLALSATGQPAQKGMTLDAYAFRLLGSSVGDAAAAGRLKADSGNGQAGRAKLAASMGEESLMRTKPMYAEAPPESHIQKKAASHAAELLSAFESIKDLLLSLKSVLDVVDASLDKDEDFVEHLKRFERAFRRAKKSFLEPDNLA